MHVYMAVQKARRDPTGAFHHRDEAEFNYRGEADPDTGDDPRAFQRLMAKGGLEVFLTKEHRGDVLWVQGLKIVTKHAKVERRAGKDLKVEA